MRATKRTTRSVKGWAKRAPKLVSERRALLARCGAKAFLDPKRLKFPIMAKSGACIVDCQGLRVAKARAAQFHHRTMVAKADKVGDRSACAWAAD